jgi:imidazolonepropionase
MKERCDLLIINANELLTLSSNKPGPRRRKAMQELGIIFDGALACREGRIVGVGSSSEILRQFEKQNATVIDAMGKIVMPGFVDPHTHLIFAGSREEEFLMRISGASYLEILKKGGGIYSTVKATRQASDRELFENGKKVLGRMLASGTTTVEVKSGYGLRTFDEIRILRVIKRLQGELPIEIIPTFLGAHAVAPEYRRNPAKYVELLVREMIPEVAKQGLANFCDVFCEEGAFNEEQSELILRAAKKNGMEPKMHVDEFAEGKGTEVAARIRARSADHLTFTGRGGARRLAAKDVIGVVLPTTSFLLRSSRFADARMQIDAGVPLALGTDFSPSAWIESMQVVVSMACLELGLTPEEAITSATINAAEALGLGNDVGSLATGKAADALILDIPTYRRLPYHFAVNLVNQVVKAGWPLSLGS